MSDQYVGEIRMFGGNFAPYGWFLCQGQLLAIAQYQALFAILGTTYGGNGTTNFALPDLRGRGPVNQGQGPGLSDYTVGEQTGVEHVTLTQSQMPAHTHLINASTNAADQASPAGGVYAAQQDAGGATAAYTKTASNTTMAANATSFSGGSQPFEILQPLLSVTFIIAYNGIFPSRN